MDSPVSSRQSDDPVERMICRWAEAKYGLKNVERVEFDERQEGPWSEWTPDTYFLLDLKIYTASSSQPQKHSEYFDARLIRDIFRFAAGAGS
jgi:hypothetical protein